MLMLRKWLTSLVKDESGASAVEYGLMVAAVAITIITAVFFLGQELNDLFNCVGESINQANDLC